jgi:hypothetical protein
MAFEERYFLQIRMEFTSILNRVILNASLQPTLIAAQAPDTPELHTEVASVISAL